MTPLQMDVLRVSHEKMRCVPLLRSQRLDVHSPADVGTARFKRKLTRDRSTYRDIDTRTLDLLLARGADVSRHCRAGDSVLLLATEYGLIKHVEKLLAHGVDAACLDRNGRSVLDVAAEHGYMDTVSYSCYWLWVRVTPSSGLGGAHRMAVRHDRVDIVIELFDRVLAAKAKGSARGLKGELLLLAIEYDTPECARLLLDRGAPIDSDGRPAILRTLLERGADGGRRLPGSSHSVVAHGSDAEMSELGRYGVDVNLLDAQKLSPLVLAARRCCRFCLMREIVRLGGRFVFPAVASRDEMAPTLATWTHEVRPAAVPALVDAMLNCGCVANVTHRQLLSALVWSGHTEEAVLPLLPMFFSPDIGPSQQAARVVEPWAIEFGADEVARALVNWSLQHTPSIHRSLDCLACRLSLTPQLRTSPPWSTPLSSPQA